MPPDPVIVAGIPASEADPCPKTGDSGAIKELRTELRAMHGARGLRFAIGPAWFAQHRTSRLDA